jgi:tetratricopeptide (TPR) repeat protein
LAKGQVLRAKYRPEKAIPEYEAVIAFNRNSPHAIAALGHCKLWIGSLEEAIRLQEQAIRLSPRDPLIGAYYLRVGQAHLLQSRIDEAIPWLEKARDANPGHPHSHAWLASAHALKGETECAAAELDEARGLSSDNRYSSLARLNAMSSFGLPKVRALSEATLRRPSAGWDAGRMIATSKLENRESRHGMRTKRLTPCRESALRSAANLASRHRRKTGGCCDLWELGRFGAAGHHDHGR